MRVARVHEMITAYDRGFQDGYRQGLERALEEQRRNTAAMIETRYSRVGPAMEWWLHQLSSQQLYDLWMGLLDVPRFTNCDHPLKPHNLAPGTTPNA